jgi:predicted Zn-dependent protease
MHETVASRFKSAAPAVDFCSMRLVDERSERVAVRQGILQPVGSREDVGVMVTVLDKGGYGYAATSDLSESGLRAALLRATDWAHRTAEHSVFDFKTLQMPRPTGDYEAPNTRPWDSLSLADKVALLQRESEKLKRSERIVDWDASLWYRRIETQYLTADDAGYTQVQHLLAPGMGATANEGSETQTRTLAFLGYCRQGGLEVLDQIGFEDRAHRLADEALQLLEAPNCPTGDMELVLMPDQMMLQIHESIGHPLELDRILGDERNYAGTSFVTLDMFGNYQYGSELLNVTYDPERPEQFASFAWDDDGTAAERTHIIEKGRLMRPLGGTISQARAGMEGVANSRATSWNRPPIDRMANLNVEPGEHSLEELVGQCERGVLMETNTSWSIDDSRNKFQFGCEVGWLIEDGQKKGMVKNPNYRGISASFWRNLAGVGDAASFDVLGTPYCGKGEPNQAIPVGHASPACRFTGVAVFGGEE